MFSSFIFSPFHFVPFHQFHSVPFGLFSHHFFFIFWSVFSPFFLHLSFLFAFGAFKYFNLFSLFTLFRVFSFFFFFFQRKWIRHLTSGRVSTSILCSQSQSSSQFGSLTESHKSQSSSLSVSHNLHCLSVSHNPYLCRCLKIFIPCTCLTIFIFALFHNIRFCLCLTILIFDSVSQS